MGTSRDPLADLDRALDSAADALTAAAASTDGRGRAAVDQAAASLAAARASVVDLVIKAAPRRR